MGEGRGHGAGEAGEGIRHQVQSEKVQKGEEPRELTEAEYEEIKSFGAE